jgi:hypothetical protein
VTQAETLDQDKHPWWSDLWLLARCAVPTGWITELRGREEGRSVGPAWGAEDLPRHRLIPYISHLEEGGGVGGGKFEDAAVKNGRRDGALVRCRRSP